MGKRVLSGAILILGSLVALYLLVFSVSETVRMVRWTRSGDSRSLLQPLSRTGPWVFNRVDSLDFHSSPYPASGDTVVAVAGEHLDSLDVVGALRLLTKPEPPGTTIEYVFRHMGKTVSNVITTRPRSFGMLAYLTAAQTLRFLTSFGYVIVGLWALVSRPNSGGVRALALFCLAMASLMISQVRVAELIAIDAAFGIPAQAAFLAGIGILSQFFGTFWLNLQILFPRPLPVARRHPVLIHLALYAPIAVILVVAQFTQAALGIWAFVVVAIQVTAGMTILGHRKGKTRVALEKRQLSLVYYGSGIGLCALFAVGIIGLIPAVRAALPLVARALLPNLTFLALLVSPISFAYAFGRYRLLEVEGKLRRGTRYVLVTGALLVLFFALLYGASHVLLNTLNVQSRTPTLAIALLLALGFAPVQRRTRLLVERRFYPERIRLRALLDGFLASTPSLPDRATFWKRLEANLQTGLGIASAVPVQHEIRDSTFRLQTGELVPVDPNGGLIRELEASSGSVMVDESIASGRVRLSEQESRWLQENRVALLVALRVHSRLTGFLAITWQEAREEMKPGELRLLVSLASQVALVNDNLRLLEENYEKKRLEEQLAMARRVQEGFLPKELPETPGLEVAALCHFSLEVAGDYYDVVSLPGDRTLLAIGDVSGKGAGAAMIMANLRASLRAISGMAVNIDSAMARLNDVMYHDTQDDQFITLFVCVYDPHTRVLTYVNAGHNAPRLIRMSGEVAPLNVRGLVLGVRPGVTYPAASVYLQPGDVVAAFTDGVSEAMNEADEEFGEERIVKAVPPIRGQAPRAIVEEIQRAVQMHTGSASFADDFTLLVARVLGG